PAPDGRFRRVQVRVKREGMRVEARAGYYGERDFAHTSAADRESQLEEQLIAPAAASQLHVESRTGWTRLAGGRFSVPITIDIAPLVTVDAGTKNLVDVLATVEDEQGRV